MKKHLILLLEALIVMVTVAGAIYVVYKDAYFGSGTFKYKDFGASLYYSVQTFNGGFIGPFLLIALLTNNIFSDLTVTAKNNKFSYLLITRKQSLREYEKNIYLKNFIINVMIFVGIQILIYVMINFKIQTINLGSATTIFRDSKHMFFNDGLINILLYTLLGGIGYGIVGDLCLAIGLLIDKPLIYRGIGALLGILLTVVPALLMQKINFLTELFQAFYLPTLIMPGMGETTYMPNMPVIVSYFLAVIVFSASTVILIKITRRLDGV